MNYEVKLPSVDDCTEAENDTKKGCGICQIS